MREGQLSVGGAPPELETMDEVAEELEDRIPEEPEEETPEEEDSCAALEVVDVAPEVLDEEGGVSWHRPSTQYWLSTQAVPIPH